MAKETKNQNKQSSSNDEDTPIYLYIPNLMGYVRFIAIVASWKFALTDP